MLRCKKNQGSQEQGDQIGRIFAHWAIVISGHFFLLHKEPTFFGLLFPQGEGCLSILTKSRIGSHFGRFFPQTHPATLLKRKPV
jgi:hypothetical protein